MGSSRVLALILAIAVLLLPTAATAETLAATDDAYVRMETPDANHGAAQLMQIRNRYGHPSHDDDFEYQALVQFQLSEIPYGSSVDSAILYLYYYNYGGANPAGRPLTCHRAMGPWVEMSVTWTSRPAFAEEPTAAAAVPGSPDAWLAFDVTADLHTLTDPHGNYGWVIRDTTRWGAVSIPTTSLRTSEYDAGFAPYLEVEISAPMEFTLSTELDDMFPLWEEWDWGLLDEDIIADIPSPLVGEQVTITTTIHNLALCQARGAHGWYSPIGRSCWGEWDFSTTRDDTVDISYRCRDDVDVDWRIELDGLHLYTMTVPGVGDTNLWNIVTVRDVPIPAGQHRIFLGTYQMDYNPDYFVDWITIGDTRIEAETYDRMGGNNPDGDMCGLTIEPRASDPPNTSRITVQLWDGEPQGSGVLLFEEFVGPTNTVADVYDDYPENYFEAHYIPSGGSADLTHQWTPVDTDTQEFYVVVDPDSLLVEIDETNNIAVFRIAARLPEYSISQSFPNPAGPEFEHGGGETPAEASAITQITYTIPSDAAVELIIYNVRGELVRILVSGTKSAGSHTVYWDGKCEDGERIASGVYFYRFASDGYEAARKLVVVR
ncbi:DNRLRE domain-containing protein [bacterium]|nr:DNRLRE domain-containing protein [bacterium]